jgi:hypothetical protein
MGRADALITLDFLWQSSIIDSFLTERRIASFRNLTAVVSKGPAID